MSEKLAALFGQTFPWGIKFASRVHYRRGYIAQEGQLVRRYLNPGSDVLVIGSGTGREARPIHHKGHRIICMDYVSAYVESGMRLARREGIGSIRFLQADAFAGLPFGHGSFDFVFFSLYSPVGSARLDVLRDIHRILRPGGLILVTCCTPLYPARHPHVDYRGWVWINGPDHLQQEVSVCGFELLETATDPGYQHYLWSILEARQTRDPGEGYQQGQ